jgi:hypothetical protein
MNNGLSVSSNWITIFNDSYSAVLDDETERPQPIDKILIPYIFTGKFVRIYTKSTSAKSKWWLAGKLLMLLEDDSQLDFIAQQWRVPLKVITLIQIPELTSEFKLKFEPAYWLNDIAIVVEKYIGE